MESSPGLKWLEDPAAKGPLAPGGQRSNQNLGRDDRAEDQAGEHALVEGTKLRPKGRFPESADVDTGIQKLHEVGLSRQAEGVAEPTFADKPSQPSIHLSLKRGEVLS